MAAQTLWCLGYPAQALQRSQEALALAQALAHPFSLALAQYWAAWLHHRRREVPAVQAQAEALLTLATAQGFPLYVGHGTCLAGLGAGHAGPGRGGPGADAPGPGGRRGHGAEAGAAVCLVLLAEAAGHAGQVEEGLRLLAEALTVLEAAGRATCWRRRIGSRAHCCCARPPDAAQAEACFQQALDYCPPPAGQILGAAGRHEPGSPVAAAGQARRGP